MQTAEPAARGHRGWEEGPFKPIGVGGTIFYPLKKSALSKGLRMYSQSEVKSLLINPQGDVIGCKVMVMPSGTVSDKHKKLIRRGELFQMILPPSYPGSSFLQKIGQRFINKAQKLEKKYRQAKYFKAKKGICISAGGFIFNRAMVEEYAPKYSKGMPLGTSQDNGSGIRLGQSVGGRTKHMDRVTAWRFLNPPMSFAKGMVINKNGKRFCNEMVYGATLGDEMCENNDGKAYLILSEELFKSSKLEAAKSLPFQRDAAKMLMTFNAVKRKNIDDLAKVYGINEDNLKESIHQYNQSAINDDYCSLGKASKDMKKIDAPYYIMDISIDSRLSPLPTLTLGGLEVDETTGNVINTQGEVIKGLFAAGRSAVGVCSNIYVSGLSIADCVFSGRRVGKYLGEII
jgi:3-oxo-5alpha-steroid 4-dehydrogenase